VIIIASSFILIISFLLLLGKFLFIHDIHEKILITSLASSQIISLLLLLACCKGDLFPLANQDIYNNDSLLDIILIYILTSFIALIAWMNFIERRDDK